MRGEASDGEEGGAAHQARRGPGDEPTGAKGRGCSRGRAQIQRPLARSDGGAGELQRQGLPGTEQWVLPAEAIQEESSGVSLLL